MTAEHVDVLIVGAGLSGIGAAWRLQEDDPTTSYLILEGRDRLGGTWDLFQYPGIRSDSDMYTLSYPFRPWRNDKAIADGADIWRYIDETASEGGIDKAIRYGHLVRSASWSSEDARWTVTSEVDGAEVVHTASFVYFCSGYYSYDDTYRPELPGLEDFQGTVVHPQFWPDDLDHSGKKVVVVGSGATAVTLVPSMADAAEHVTMLQRTPTYITALPAEDKLAQLTLKVLPDGIGHRINRARLGAMTVALFQLCRRFPAQARKFLIGRAQKMLPEGYDMRHFTPPYDPWDQRLCVVPSGDLFRQIRHGNASIVTDTIDTFDATGVRVSSGEHLDADIVVTATGLQVQTFGGAKISVDGREIDTSQTYAYKGLMFSGIPNLAYCIGYTNASWSLRADLSHQYVTKLLRHLKEHGYRSATPQLGEDVGDRPFLDLDSGYVRRALAVMPKQGTQRPWTVRQNWILDSIDMARTDLTEDMAFTS